MCLVSSEGRFLSTNPRFCEIVGYSAEELLAQNSIETTHPDDRAGEAEITARMLAGELQTSNWEKRFVHRDGRVVWCNLTLALMPPRTGEAQQFVGVIDDISERKKAETATKGLVQTQQELATSDLPVQALMELIAERARGLTDAAGGVVELVDGAELVYTAGAGMVADKIGLRFKREGSLSELALKTHSVLKADDTETDPRCDRVACRKVGARSMVVVPLVRVGTEFVGVLKVMSDRPAAFTDRDVNNLQILTETLGAVIQRQRAAERLLQTVERFDRATHAGGLGVWDWDVQTNHLVWDDRLYQIYGLRREDFSNAYEAWATTVHPADLGRTDAEVQAALRGEKEFDTEFRTVWPDGSIHHIYAVGHVVRDADGTPLRMTGFNADITERKKLEAQFLRAQRMESVGTLASGIAHDMNNILAPIMMSVQLLKEDSKDEATLDMLSTLESCSRRGADLVRQLLSFTRGFDGQQVAVDITLVIRELQKVMKEVFPKDVQFEISAGRDLWTTIGDPSQLHQVLLNLCVNARDAMPRGGKLMIELENIVLDEFYVAMNPDGKAGGYVVIGVSDTGTGIAPAVLDKIFEPFFTTKELGKGTGLGLSTVIGIVKNHGGFVTVYSEVGKGTQFKVYLPAQTSETQLEEVSVTQSGIPRGNGELILLVDDERGVRQVAVRTLVRFGYRVVEAANGAEAVALYVQHQQDVALVLTDVSMPIMDGVALITALRSVNPQVRIVVSSGLPFSGGVARAVEFGVRHFIPKPYTADKLLGIIHQELHS